MRNNHSDIRPIDIGDLKMFQHYYTELYEELMYFLSSYIEDAALREDLIQDVWMKLWENQTSFQGELALKTYVYHAVRNAAISRLPDRRVTYMDDLSFLAPAEDGEERAADRLLAESLLASLPPEQRRLVYCKYFLDMTVRAIAAEIQKSKSYVHKEISRAEDRMRKILLERGQTGQNIGY